MTGFGKKMSVFQVLLLLGLVWGLAEAVCPNGCQCNDESLHVSCVEANLDIVPITLNPSITRLNLRNNKIRALDTGFHFYHQLTHIDLSHNHLVKISPGSFGQQPNLVTLFLNNNRMAHLSNVTFGTGLTSLTVLSIRENFIETIEPATFAHTRSLEELDLGSNRLKVLNTSCFVGLGNLRTLRIDKNELNQVPEVFSGKTISSGSGSGGGFGSGSTGGFGGGSNSGSSGNNVYLPHLTELFLGTNQIETLKDDAFAGVKNLATLDLRGNKIKSIEPFAFRGLNMLRKLVLMDNELMSVPTVAFAPLSQLELLKIGKNPIGKFDKNAFHGLRNLKTLEMQGAPELQEIDKEAFGSNSNLEHFELSKGSKLAYLPSKLFHQQSMSKLMLQENGLTTLPEDLVNWRNVRMLDLEGNPFNCVCDLLWLRDLLLEKFRNESTFVLCAQPEKVKENKLILVSNKDLNCYLNGPVEKTILGVSVALAVILLIVFFFLLYKYHDRIKNTCKRGFRRPARKNRNTVISSGKDRGGMDTSTKTSFLSQTQYPYSDEEFAIRASLMSASPPQSASFLHTTHSLHHHPHHQQQQHPHFPGAHNSLRHGTTTLPHHLQQNHHNNSNNGYGGPPNYNDYDTPHVNLNNMNYPHFPTLHSGTPDHNMQMHYPAHPQHPPPPLVKPIPITEL